MCMYCAQAVEPDYLLSFTQESIPLNDGLSHPKSKVSLSSKEEYLSVSALSHSAKGKDVSDVEGGAMTTGVLLENFFIYYNIHFNYSIFLR